jgi:hypothetical protein
MDIELLIYAYFLRIIKWKNDLPSAYNSKSQFKVKRLPWITKSFRHSECAQGSILVILFLQFDFPVAEFVPERFSRCCFLIFSFIKRFKPCNYIGSFCKKLYLQIISPLFSSSDSHCQLECSLEGTPSVNSCNGVQFFIFTLS